MKKEKKKITNNCISKDHLSQTVHFSMSVKMVYIGTVHCGDDGQLNYIHYNQMTKQLTRL